jgi:hypothetical protein
VRSCLTLIAAGLVLSSACDKTSPNRDQVPVIRSQFGRLHAALQNRDASLLDSLASRDLTDDRLSVDSLIRFVWGAHGEKRFDHFGPNEIIYNKKKARIDCPLVDSSGRTYLEVTWTLVREKDSWLLKRFETGVPPIDSVR